MKVFISWSGDKSRAIAETIRGWLPSVIQAVKPYFSPDDIAKGSRWSPEVAKELEDCKVGLICLTSENLDAPWVMFEAGALSKSISVAHVCPLLFGIEPSDVKGPLVQFQAASFTKDDMKKVVKMMNQELGSSVALASDVLDSVFEMWWPKLEEEIKSIMSSDKGSIKKKFRSERDMLEEILARVRAIPSSVPRRPIIPFAIEGLLSTYAQLIREANKLSPEARCELDNITKRLFSHIEYLDRNLGLDEDAYRWRSRLLNKTQRICENLPGDFTIEVDDTDIEKNHP